MEAYFDLASAGPPSGGGRVRPMLATTGPLPAGPGWAFELKWDGVRALAHITDGALRMYARSGAEITVAYPELHRLVGALSATGAAEAVLDGELIALDGAGRPSFARLAERMHVRDAGRAAGLAASCPVTYMVFDLLRLGDEDLQELPYLVRRERLEALVAGLGAGPWVVPPSFEDGPATVAAAREMALEGVVAKRQESAYRQGLRSPDWIKIKNDLTGDFVVGGWRTGSR